MKINEIHGWKDVFAFTLIQTIKSKAYIISNVIFLLIAFVSLPIITMLTSAVEEDPNAANPIQKVYVNNETSLPMMDFSAADTAALSHITYEVMTEDYDTVSERIDTDENTSVIFTLSEDQGMYSLSFAKAGSGPVKDISLQQLGEAVAEQFNNFKFTTLGLSEEQVAILQAAVYTSASKTDANGDVIMKEDTTISSSEYWFIYGILFIILMVNSIASSQIATSIVTEKSTRVIEYLLTSVKPLALMLGKVLAMLIAVMIQMVGMMIVVFISNSITVLLSVGNGDSLMLKYLPTDIFQNLNIVNFFFCIVLALLGLIFYATLASLAGATVSKLEEINEGLTLFTLTNIVGAYIGIGAAAALMGAGESAYVTFAFLFPLSSPFILPGAILIGKADLLIILAAIVLQLVFIALLFKFVAKVFETLILHTGNTIKVKSLIKLFKTV